MKYLTYLYAIVCVACNSNPHTLTNQSGLNAKDSIILKLQGVWGDRDGFKGWQITNDSIYYFNERKAYKFNIQQNNMIVFYKSGPYILESIRVIKDTLFFKMDGTGGGEVKAFRISQ